MWIESIYRGSYRPAQKRPQVVLVADELASSMHALPQLDETKTRATITQAERNVARARRFLFRGEWHTVREIADMIGLSRNAVRLRIRGEEVIDGKLYAGTPPRTYEFRGERLTVRQIAERTGMKIDAVYQRTQGNRFHAFGELRDTIREPRINARMITFRGLSLPLATWARRQRIPVYVLAQRLKRGWSLDRALRQPALVKPRKPLPVRVRIPSDRGVSENIPLPQGDRRPTRRTGFPHNHEAIPCQS